MRNPILAATLLSSLIPGLCLEALDYGAMRQLPPSRYDQPGIRMTAKPSDISLIGEDFVDDPSYREEAPQEEQEEFLFSLRKRLSKIDEEPIALEEEPQSRSK